MGASVGKSLTISGIEVTLLKQVGSGGFADIFLASRKGDSKPRYALKRMYAQKGDAEKSRVCKWEYQVNQRMIKHPNLVSCVGAQCVEHSSGDQEYLLLLEYMEGGTLLDWIQSSEHAKKQSADVVYIFRQLVDGLSVLHAHCPPIRHQDLKPENFLAVSPDGKGEWRLCDFGSSTIENWTVKTNAERVYVGGMLEKTTTPSYRAPEMCDLYSGREINQSADCWALGVIVYTMMFREQPFPDGALATLSGKYRIPESHRWSPKLIAILGRLLTLDPTKRMSVPQLQIALAEMAPPGSAQSKVVPVQPWSMFKGVMAGAGAGAAAGAGSPPPVPPMPSSAATSTTHRNSLTSAGNSSNASASPSASATSTPTSSRNSHPSAVPSSQQQQPTQQLPGQPTPPLPARPRLAPGTLAAAAAAASSAKSPSSATPPASATPSNASSAYPSLQQQPASAAFDDDFAPSFPDPSASPLPTPSPNAQAGPQALRSPMQVGTNQQHLSVTPGGARSPMTTMQSPQSASAIPPGGHPSHAHGGAPVVHIRPAASPSSAGPPVTTAAVPKLAAPVVGSGTRSHSAAPAPAAVPAASPVAAALAPILAAAAAAAAALAEDEQRRRERKAAKKEKDRDSKPSTATAVATVTAGRKGSDAASQSQGPGSAVASDDEDGADDGSTSASSADPERSLSKLLKKLTKDEPTGLKPRTLSKLLAQSWVHRPDVASMLAAQVAAHGSSMSADELARHMLAWEGLGSGAFFAALSKRPLGTRPCVAFKSLLLLHRVLQGGSPPCLGQVYVHRRVLEEIESFWALDEPAGRLALSNAQPVSALVAPYAKHLLHRLAFHQLHPHFEGSFSLGHYLWSLSRIPGWPNNVTPQQQPQQPQQQQRGQPWKLNAKMARDDVHHLLQLMAEALRLGHTVIEAPTALAAADPAAALGDDSLLFRHQLLLPLLDDLHAMFLACTFMLVQLCVVLGVRPPQNAPPHWPRGIVTRAMIEAANQAAAAAATASPPASASPSASSQLTPPPPPASLRPIPRGSAAALELDPHPSDIDVPLDSAPENAEEEQVLRSLPTLLSAHRTILERLHMLFAAAANLPVLRLHPKGFHLPVTISGFLPVPELYYPIASSIPQTGLENSALCRRFQDYNVSQGMASKHRSLSAAGTFLHALPPVMAAAVNTAASAATGGGPSPSPAAALSTTAASVSPPASSVGSAPSPASGAGAAADDGDAAEVETPEERAKRKEAKRLKKEAKEKKRAHKAAAAAAAEDEEPNSDAPAMALVLTPFTHTSSAQQQQQQQPNNSLLQPPGASSAAAAAAANLDPFSTPASPLVSPEVLSAGLSVDGFSSPSSVGAQGSSSATPPAASAGAGAFGDASSDDPFASGTQQPLSAMDSLDPFASFMPAALAAKERTQEQVRSASAASNLSSPNPQSATSPSAILAPTPKAATGSSAAAVAAPASRPSPFSPGGEEDITATASASPAVASAAAAAAPASSSSSAAAAPPLERDVTPFKDDDENDETADDAEEESGSGFVREDDDDDEDDEDGGALRKGKGKVRTEADYLTAVGIDPNTRPAPAAAKKKTKQPKQPTLSPFDDESSSSDEDEDADGGGWTHHNDDGGATGSPGTGPVATAADMTPFSDELDPFSDLPDASSSQSNPIDLFSDLPSNAPTAAAAASAAAVDLDSDPFPDSASSVSAAAPKPAQQPPTPFDLMSSPITANAAGAQSNSLKPLQPQRPVQLSPFDDDLAASPAAAPAAGPNPAPAATGATSSGGKHARMASSMSPFDGADDAGNPFAEEDASDAAAAAGAGNSHSRAASAAAADGLHEFPPTPVAAAKPGAVLGKASANGSGGAASAAAASSSAASAPSSSPSAAVPGHDDLLPDEIEFSELTFDERIGIGAFAEVYSGTWRGTDVAIKRLYANQFQSAEATEEFRREIQLLRTLRHPNILLFMAACTRPTHLCVVTELMSTSLFDLLHNSDVPIPWRLALQIASDAAKGMTYLHLNKGGAILHRDMKSPNILLDSSRRAKICDFGLSRTKAQSTALSGQAGTYQWMAPEVIAGGDYTEAADVYSFGIILWEIVSREIPYKGMNAAQVSVVVLTRGLRPPMPADAPVAYAALVRACWDAEASNRPPFPFIVEKLNAQLAEQKKKPIDHRPA